MIVYAINDLHGNLPLDIPTCDLLCITGDICPHGSAIRVDDIAYQRSWLDTVYRAWLHYVPAAFVVITWGNHDWVGQAGQAPPGLPHTLLVDQTATVCGLTIHGSPWSKPFYDWAYMKPDNQLALEWAKIPKEVDILMVHGPAYGIHDQTRDGRHEGSNSLRYWLETRLRPRLLLTGHIHEARGITHDPYELVGMTAVNASHVNAAMQPVQLGMKLRWPPK
jgi:Icc-related predicted phosphoesterase